MQVAEEGLDLILSSPHQSTLPLADCLAYPVRALSDLSESDPDALQGRANSEVAHTPCETQLTRPVPRGEARGGF